MLLLFLLHLRFFDDGFCWMVRLLPPHSMGLHFFSFAMITRSHDLMSTAALFSVFTFASSRAVYGVGCRFAVDEDGWESFVDILHRMLDRAK